MPANKLNISNKKETLAEFAERYSVLARPNVVQQIMQRFTYKMDSILKQRMESLPTHPKDTGLMKHSWQIPMQYLKTNSGKQWQVYLLNTATVGEQARLKGVRNLVHRKKKLTGRHNLKRYMPWVDKRTKFYTKQLRVIRNKIDSEFKEYISAVLWEANKQGLLSIEEAMQMGKEFK